MTVAAGLAFLAVLVAGVPHGAADARFGSGAWSARWGRRGPALFVLAYLGILAGVVAAWIVAPAAALLALFMLGILHFGEEERGWARILRGALPVMLPAVLWPGPLFSLVDPLIGAVPAEARVGVRIDALAVLFAASWAAWHRPGWRGEIAMNLLLPPPFGFAAYFVLLHSLPLLRRQAQRRGVTLLRHVLDYAVFSVGAIALLIGFVLWQGAYWSHLLLGLLMLSVPHMTMPHLTARMMARPRLRADTSGRPCVWVGKEKTTHVR
ncbi:beta-carotene 15,15'-dioxygenase, Brp/Blh family [uncultured Croceicoccus sp.]|uniref:beta-carotene 15,15'-dioxygenase, Brp/Blh family n=1 Tax=uncultured Croceicoccus sp. TaxID=1295329 RepID=UPI002608BD61|nr:beta-carotene 15,15'-dioxygenase, Brp/Blh family [uncultured Croceicoccus sp.]